MALLEARVITKRFAGITALDEVSISVDAGGLVGLIGPNGAGKTTFFNCLLGILRPDTGSVVFDAVDITRMSTHRRARLGFGRTFQRVELFTGMTVRDHLVVAERAHRRRGALWKDLLGLGRIRDDEVARADRVLGLLGILDVARRPVESLSLGRARLVEVGRALMTHPKLLLLDEPSSGLDRGETDELTETLLEVHAETGMAILLVEHDVEMVQRFATSMYVLDFGTLIAQGTTAEVFADPAVREAYLGDIL